MEWIVFLLGLCIGAVAMLDVFLLMAYHDLKKGARR